MAHANDSFENWLDFRKNETPKPIKLICTECGEPAQGNFSWTDGSGHICDKCDALFGAAKELKE